MSSRPDHPHPAGAHRVPRAGRSTHANPPRVPERYLPHLDGLYTYCLSVLCEHDAAAAVLGETLALADRHHGRRPADAELYRPWLYALTRWACLRRLTEATTRPGPAGPAGPDAAHPGADAATTAAVTVQAPADTGPRPRSTAADDVAAAFDRPHPAPPAQPGPTARGTTGADEGPETDEGGPGPAGRERLRRRELATLAWPEAAGTTPEQREALELATRHRLTPREVAAVLGRETAATRTLLAAASCEVERTRAALAVVESGRCPEVARFAADSEVLLGAGLRRELVRHVDECEECRRVAERAGSLGPWPGTAPAGGAPLPIVTAPPAAVAEAMAAARASRSGRADTVAGAAAEGGRRSRRMVPLGGALPGASGLGSSPRYDRSGFPVGPKDRAARRHRLRSRAVTTTVVATVLAAPVLALWAAYRGAPMTGETHGVRSAASRTHSDHDELDGRPYENAGNARTSPGDPRGSGRAAPEVSVRVAGGASGGRPGESRGPGRLTITAEPHGEATVVTLTASGGAPVHWSASSGATWLRMSATSGTLRPGQSTRLTVAVDTAREPARRWVARVRVAPVGAVVTIEGRGRGGRGDGGGAHRPGGGHSPGHHPRPGGGPGHSVPPHPLPSPVRTYPSDPGSADPTPSPSPSAPGSPSPTGTPPSGGTPS